MSPPPREPLSQDAALAAAGVGRGRAQTPQPKDTSTVLHTCRAGGGQPAGRAWGPTTARGGPRKALWRPTWALALHGPGGAPV
jgi:hypothetical protein